MHNTQEKILKLMDTCDVSALTLREMAAKIGETGSPQKIKHHLDQLAKKGLIVFDKANNRIEKITAGINHENNLISLPILGSANCGQAVCFADNRVEGYLKVSKSVLGNELAKRAEDLFVLHAVGQSMNRAQVDGDYIEDGDFVIVDKTKKIPVAGGCFVSIIDGVANIKSIFIDNKNQQIILTSESNQDLPPIYIHQKDMTDYFLAGKVVKVLKQPDEFADWLNASASDILKDIGDISKEEYDYYDKLCSQKQI